jgi:hypothetical protein
MQGDVVTFVVLLLSQRHRTLATLSSEELVQPALLTLWQKLTNL